MYVMTSRQLGSIHLSAEISFRAESFGTVPEFLAESIGSKCHFGTQMYGPYVPLRPEE